MEQSECEGRIYSCIIQSQKEDLKLAYERREKMKQELIDYTELEHTIKLMSENKDVSENGLQTSVNLGCDFYVDALVKNPDRILISVGLDLFMECTFPDALTLIASKQKMLEHQIEFMTSQIAQIESYITLSTMTIGPQAKFHLEDVAIPLRLDSGCVANKPSILEALQKDLLNKLKQ